VLSCSDQRYLPARYREAPRHELLQEYQRLKLQTVRM
jgi:hypothetical protein